MPVWPFQGQVVHQTPPPFTWPQVRGSKYLLEIRHADGFVELIPTDRNWVLLDQALPAGAYSWRVSTLSRKMSGNGVWRGFSVEEETQQFIIPQVDELFLRAREKPHPKSLPSMKGFHEILSDRKKGMEVLVKRVEQNCQNVLPFEPKFKLINLAKREWIVENRREIQGIVYRERRFTLEAAFAWAATRKIEYLQQAKQRALNLASWDPSGSTGFQLHDQASLAIAWTLSLAYDWLYDGLELEERQKLLWAIRPRLRDMKVSLFGNDYKIDRFPFDSHGAVTLAHVSAISILLAGDLSEIENIFKESVPRYLLWPVPWGRDDGGYANGTNYAQWDIGTDTLPVWDIYREALGIDFGLTLWGKGYGRFITYFLPSGSPRGVFGDGAERMYRKVWALQAQAYADRFASSLSTWYADQYTADSEDHLLRLMSPKRKQADSKLPLGTPNSIHIPSIGWVAMHSDISSSQRTSFYFKSSPYGSYNHSHADQNSFILNVRGQALIIDSGYYDYYNSPHWNQWAKQTVAHNAITFDGGVGQLHDTMAAKGEITMFEPGGSFDMVTGDATGAYGVALKRAVRSLVYIRPGTLIIYDELQSTVPRQWEWNIHSLAEMDIMDDKSIIIEQGNVKVCVDILDGPDMYFSQTDNFTATPAGENRPNQWHGVFYSRQKLNDSRILAIITVDCQKPKVSIFHSDDQTRVFVDEKVFVFCED